MTVTSTYSPVKYIGDGIQKDFNIVFRFIDKEHIRAKTTICGQDTPLTFGRDYTVVGTTLTMTAALPMNAQLTLYMEMPNTQETKYKNTGELNLNNIEADYDRAALERQLLQEQVDRAIKMDVTSAETPEEFKQHLFQAAQGASDSAAVAIKSEGEAKRSEVAATLAKVKAKEILTAVEHVRNRAAESIREQERVSRNAVESGAERHIARAKSEADRAENAAATATDIASGNHNGLLHRDAVNCHPIQSIEGLSTVLGNKLDKGAQAEDSAKLGGVQSHNFCRKDMDNVIAGNMELHNLTMGTTEEDTEVGYSLHRNGKRRWYSTDLPNGKLHLTAMNDAGEYHGAVWFVDRMSRVMNFEVTPTVHHKSIWHAGNDGSGSGLDADTLDGHHASDMLNQMQLISTRHTLGTWTLTGLTIGKPVVIGMDSNTVFGREENEMTDDSYTSHYNIRVLSGSSIGKCHEGWEFTLLSANDPRWRTSPSYTIIPTDSSVVIELTSAYRHGILYAYH